MAEKYLALGSQFTSRLDKEAAIGDDNIPHLRDEFNAYNRHSLPYIQRATAADIRNLTKSKDRLWTFCTTYSTPLTLLVPTMATLSSGSFLVQAIQSRFLSENSE